MSALKVSASIVFLPSRVCNRGSTSYAYAEKLPFLACTKGRIFLSYTVLAGSRSDLAWSAAAPS